LALRQLNLLALTMMSEFKEIRETIARGAATPSSVRAPIEQRASAQPGK
jgi:hypothetical protein